MVLLLLTLGALAQPSERARKLIDLGRHDAALELLSGQSVTERLLRTRALLKSRRYTEARQQIQELEQLNHGAFPAPLDFSFYLQRGHLLRLTRAPDLAAKNFQEAERRAETAEQKLRLLDERCALLLSLSQVDRAQQLYDGSGELLGQVDNPWAVAEHLELGSELMWEQGQTGSSWALNRAAREIYLANDNPIAGARVLFANRRHYLLTNERDETFEVARRALREFEQAGDRENLPDCLQAMTQTVLRMGVRGKDELDGIFRQVLEKMPEGVHRNRVRLNYSQYLEIFEAPPERILEVLAEVVRRGDPERACTAHQFIAYQHIKVGRYAEAREQLELALEKSRPQVYGARGWQASPGQVMLQLSILERTQHHHHQALEWARKAADSQPGPDWTNWRVEVRYEGLQAALETFDFEQAEREVEASLKDLSRLTLVHEKANGLTTLLAALLIDKSIGTDVLDPADLALGDYGVQAAALIREAFKDPATVREYMGVLDAWHSQTQRRKERRYEAFPLAFKGLFLEALGRLAEARDALESGVTTSRRHQNRMAEIVCHLLLARVDRRQGKGSEAVEHLARAAELSLKVNSYMARFYHLLAGSAQREEGRYPEALESFGKAVEASPKTPWKGLYGRALTLERMGRSQEALHDLNQALEQIKPHRKVVSEARIQAARARLLARSGRAEEALALFKSAHGDLLASAAAGYLPEVTLDYADCLAAAKDESQALQLTRQTLETLLEWQTADPRSLFERVVTLALKLGDRQTALHYLQLSHSAELTRSVSLTQVEHRDPETNRLLSDVEQLKFRLANLRERSGQAASTQERESLGQVLAETRQQFFAKMAELKAREPDFEALVQLSGSQLSAIQGELREGSALLEYFPAEHSLYTFVVTRDGFSLHEISLSRGELNQLVSQYLEAVGQPPGRSDHRPFSQRLHRLLIGSLGLENYRALRVVPSGSLWRVPFSELQDSAGRPLNERYQVTYLTSADILRILESRDRKTTRPQAPLLVAGADLAGAQQELSQLSRLLPNSRRLVGAESSYDALRQRAPQHDLLHIASHSGLADVLTQSFVELGSERMTLEQIYGLKLQPGSLVVLSSCHSAVGEEHPGREVTSLASAFSIAGASTVIASRWEVDDQATAEFFGHFYRALNQNHSRAESLRKARIEMARRRPHPYYWAAFSLVGDPR